jgi:hypothetical protein
MIRCQKWPLLEDDLTIHALVQKYGFIGFVCAFQFYDLFIETAPMVGWWNHQLQLVTVSRDRSYTLCRMIRCQKWPLLEDDLTIHA